MRKNNDSSKLSRRKLFQQSGKYIIGGAVLPWWFSARDLFAASDATMLKAPDNQYSGIWTGDDFNRIHPLVQGRKDLFQIKDIAGDNNKYDYIVVGGGMSGLTAAYLLQKKKKRVLLIDQAPEVGGNAKMQKWGDVPYSIGAAYFVNLEEDDPIFALYKEWGILEKRKKIKDSDNGVQIKKKIFMGFFEGNIDPDSKKQISKFVEYLRHVNEEKYPDVPFDKEGAYSEEEMRALDSISIKSHLRKEMGADLHPYLEKWLEYYCHSSFGGSPDEISAWCGLNFLACETGDIFALPGGNSFMAKRISQLISKKGGHVTVINNQFVFNVEDLGGKGVKVSASDMDGKRVFEYHGEKAVMGCNKMVASRIINNFPKERDAAISKMKYRAYIVANALISKPFKKSFYDVYLLDPEMVNSHEAVFADYILANHSIPGAKTPYSVLTLYKPLAYNDGRLKIQESDFIKIKAEISKGLAPVLKANGLSEMDIADINLTRWGHPLILSEPGNLANNIYETASRPIGNISFIGQDSEGVPAIENAIHSAIAFAKGNDI